MISPKCLSHKFCFESWAAKQAENQRMQHLTMSQITYQELINRDFDNGISMIAVNKYPNDLNKVVNCILNLQTPQNQQNLDTDNKNECKNDDFKTDTNKPEKIVNVESNGNKCLFQRNQRMFVIEPTDCSAEILPTTNTY